MTYIIYLIGGSARITKILKHLIAAKTLFNVTKIVFVIFDPDIDHGDTADAKNFLSTFDNYKNAFGLDLKIKYAKWDYNSHIDTKMPLRQGQKSRTLNDEFCSDGDNSKINIEIVKSQFTEEECTINTRGGFYGDPHVGATFIKCSEAHVSAAELLDGEISNDGNQGEYRIMLLASTYGGTGASSFGPLAEAIRAKINKIIGTNANSKNKIKMAGLLLFPYFTYAWGENNQSPDPSDSYFSAYYTVQDLKTRTNNFRNLYYTETENAGRIVSTGLFDQMYIAGNKYLEKIDSSDQSGSNSNGNSEGSKQRNRCTVTDYIVASLCVHFANCPPDQYVRNPVFYDLGEGDSVNVQGRAPYEVETCTIDMLPYAQEIKKYTLFLLLFAYQHAFFYTNENEKAKVHPIIKNIAPRKEQLFNPFNLFEPSIDKKQSSQFISECKDKSKELFSWCVDYFRLLNEMNNGINKNDSTINNILFTNEFTATLLSKIESMTLEGYQRKDTTETATFTEAIRLLGITQQSADMFYDDITYNTNPTTAKEKYEAFLKELYEKLQ